MAKSTSKSRKKTPPKPKPDIAKELAEALTEKSQDQRTSHAKTPLPQVGDKVTFTESKAGTVYEISRVRHDGREVDLHLPGTNLDRFRVNPEDLTFVERRSPALAREPAKPTFDVAELTERIAAVQRTNMDQLSGEIAVLKKYLKSKRIGTDHQALTRRFIDQVQHAHTASIVSPRADEVIAPDMVRVVGLSRTHEPSLSHKRPRGFCLFGTFSPSRRQMRSTRSLPTCQPARCSNAVIRRYP